MHSHFVQISQPIVIRVNEVGLEEAANCTRQWLSMAAPHLALPDIRQVFVNSFAAGEIIVRNITIDRFVPPHIRFLPNTNSTIQMLTHSGYAEISADWELRSELLRVLSLPLMGSARIQMTGLISEVTMKKVSPEKLEVSQCVARIRDLRLNLQGSVAADILQLFKTSLTKVIRRKLEEDYCTLMDEFWMSWMEAQLSQFPSNLTLSSEPEVVLVQTLQSIVPSKFYVDLRMRSDLIWDGELLESDNIMTYANVNPQFQSKNSISETDKQSSRMISIFVEEDTVQNILKAAHYAGHFRTTVQSPFLQTQCDVLCIGTVLPELAEAMPNSSLAVQVSTLHAPIIALHDGQATVFVNASLDIISKSVAARNHGTLISINVATDFILKLAIENRRAVNLLVEMSTPFLEDAVELLISRGVPVTSLFQFPSRNEHLVIQDKFIRLETDVDFPALLQYSPAT
ncbi:unnamed protein product [Heligmosomoides polygyrus]|uniref:BPI2 domain-containing protein n=1 Tax=Heligmosomoides polygyrus TaxID=6339 RepID=A0A3P8D5R5_HELPZ|nr:unnamed protein product [Heligmosomoides polygyrus]